MWYRKEGASEKKSAKAASSGKAGKDAEKTPKASKGSAVAKEQAAIAFEFDDEGVQPAAKKQKSSATPKGGRAWNLLCLWVLFGWGVSDVR